MTAQEILEKLSHFKYGDACQLNEINTIIELAKKLPPNPIILETGTLVGKAACAWALVTGGTVYTVEFNDNMTETVANIKSVGLEGKVIPIHGDSTKIPWDKMVDVVWLDSNHDMKTLMLELHKYSPYVRHLICGHDYQPEVNEYPNKFPDVKPTIDSWFGGKHSVDNLIWYKWLEPMIDVVSLFIGRMYCIDIFFKGLEELDYPKKRMNLIWHDTSHIKKFTHRLTDWLQQHGHEYNSTMIIDCPDPHFHFEESGDAPPKAMWQITQAYNHCRNFCKSKYFLALEDDTVPPADGLRRLVSILETDKLVKGCCGLNIYRPSIDAFKRIPILWTIKEQRTFPQENIENGYIAVIIEKFGKGIEYIGSGHLGFTLLDGDWVRLNEFIYRLDKIGGCDTNIGHLFLKQGFKYVVDWDCKCKHYDIDGSYV
jgi:hypothetical protein